MKFGYGQWEAVKMAIRRSPSFRFDYFLKSLPTEQVRRPLRAAYEGSREGSGATRKEGSGRCWHHRRSGNKMKMKFLLSKSLNSKYCVRCGERKEQDEAEKKRVELESKVEEIEEQIREVQERMKMLRPIHSGSQ
jgi:SWI/SNF-related matrix-associated actin-dependent regulator of chromatin subfamily A member 5